jgi:hypothetical protein
VRNVTVVYVVVVETIVIDDLVAIGNKVIVVIVYIRIPTTNGIVTAHIYVVVIVIVVVVIGAIIGVIVGVIIGVIIGDVIGGIIGGVIGVISTGARVVVGIAIIVT